MTWPCKACGAYIYDESDSAVICPGCKAERPQKEEDKSKTAVDAPTWASKLTQPLKNQSLSTLQRMNDAQADGNLPLPAAEKEAHEKLVKLEEGVCTGQVGVCALSFGGNTNASA